MPGGNIVNNIVDEIADASIRAMSSGWTNQSRAAKIPL
jgi:hypothetical protein